MARTIASLMCAFIILGAGCLGGRGNPLVGTGPLPLSATNPFLGVNQFLGEQLSQGRNLRELFLLRGGPDAAEITHNDSVNLFYIKLHQTYIAHRIMETDGRSEWVVRGPFVMARRQYVNLIKLGIYPGSAPVFLVNGRLTNFRLPPTPTPTSTPLSITARPQSHSGMRRAQRRRAVPTKREGVQTRGIYSKASGAIATSPTPNSDQRALSMSRPTPIPVDVLRRILGASASPIAAPPIAAPETVPASTPTAQSSPAPLEGAPAPEDGASH